MQYRINEIFYSLQGEGLRTGVPTVFVRFAGCNLRCHFCDTAHEEFTPITAREILAEVNRYPSPALVLTGGEPTMQLTEELLRTLKEGGKQIAVETNGSVALSEECLALIDWVTVSPKALPVRIGRADEVKMVFEGTNLESVERAAALARSMGAAMALQPCDVGEPQRNRRILADTIQYILDNPDWRLSLQTHKLLSIR